MPYSWASSGYEFGVLTIIETGRLDPTPMTTHRFPFSQVERAFQMMVTKEDNIIKPLITY